MYDLRANARTCQQCIVAERKLKKLMRRIEQR
uniref:Uncharacterized protein n=1 Tax=Anguilla anguilla TaxID=7936 RepID=A0A0E9QG61_ANGAN